MNLYRSISEMNDLEFGRFMVSDLEARFDVDLFSIIEDRSKSLEDIYSEVSKALKEAVFKFHEDKGHQDWIRERPVKSIGNPGLFDPVPGFFMSPQVANDLTELRGEDIKNEMRQSQVYMSKMLDADSYQSAASYLFSAGYLAISAEGAQAYIDGIVEGLSILKAVSFSLAVITFAEMLEVLIPFIIIFPFIYPFTRPAHLLGLVINRTEHNFVAKDYKNTAGDLYMNTGKMTSFMKDHEKLGQVKPDFIQIHKMMDWIFDDQVQYGVFGGYYFAEKRSGAWVGSDGAMILSALDNSVKFAHEFAVPYSKSNGTNVEFMSSDDNRNANSVFKGLRKHQAVTKTLYQSPYVLTSSINSKHHQSVALIASITDENSELNNSSI
ncbi:hypothetical protein AB4440_05900 [Vibrio splendidus]|uniref:hypothetical protein n=1 Tax=Vibrio splendidus TaxID=29497 RepID=UPI000C84D6DC|nr:hypothetical protein [Vibrio splendidus]PMO91171.1 hypothetical protein BCS97_22195 [Vibrio splendidus]PMP19975.1 hypothetical protein BCS89_20050 [Vibrio splendidus]PMP26991.1 hypothetical protein BCS88_21855 [Vibrio splendidus]PMP42507.1 hypothetical protein BCS85_21345 [Vibrio splendidus]PMP45921.1 hypothetical protein BCS87_23520 [Vibrio splendidus]